MLYDNPPHTRIIMMIEFCFLHIIVQKQEKVQEDPTLKSEPLVFYYSYYASISGKFGSTIRILTSYATHASPSQTKNNNKQHNDADSEWPFRAYKAS